jgi:general secretion pathway protein D
MLSPIHPSAEGRRGLAARGESHHGLPSPSTSRPRSRWSLLLVLAGALAAGGCASATASHLGREAEGRQDYDQAVVEYTKAVRQHPNDRDARLGLERAKLRAAADHFQRGRRLAATGKLDQALVEFQLASELNPVSGEIDKELRATRNELRAKVAVVREDKTALETLIERVRDLPPQGLDLPQGVKMPASLQFHDASSREAFLAIARLAGVSLGFDPTFRDAPVTVDLRNATLENALSSVADATHTFIHITSPGSVLVIPDTAAKRREYEEEVVRVFYLSNADLKETMDLLRIVLDARRISPVSGTNALSIRDTPERIAAAARILSAIDKARPEVIIDVELLEVDRNLEAEYGLQIASAGSSGINGTATIAPGGSTTPTLNQLLNLTSSDVLLANLPSLYYRLLKSDTNTRTLANPQLRTAEGMLATARFGDRVPVPVTTFAPIATGGTPQQPITSYNYENIGVNIDITPRTHHDDDVTLQLKVVVQSVSGTGFGGLPTFSNREISTVIRLRDGETNMLSGLIQDVEQQLIEGVPGLSDIPGVGRLFSHKMKQTTQTDIILTLTPHIIRVLDLTEGDLRAFRVGRDSLAGVVVTEQLPVPFELPRPAATPPAQPIVPPAAASPGAPPPASTPPASTPPASIPPPAPQLPGGN